jgi:lipopolysaccharide/colanic/teichoic acid biosynthesis glycosyltransferase
MGGIRLSEIQDDDCSGRCLQDRLRVVNQVDGPQFKIEDDPRITGIGKFLRDTCIDEIPQFINVLLGQMSVVGPRPSPDRENRTCPAWRDARLSVRPGITGLWQISRTRKIGWIFRSGCIMIWNMSAI